VEKEIKKKKRLSLMTIQAEALRRFKDVKVKFCVQDSWLVMGGFIDFNHANFCNLKVSGDTASADIKAALSYPETVREIIDSGGCTG
jgi:hypothetical protein